MKVAIVHDYLIDYGGAEKVLLALHDMYPKAPIYVSILNKEWLGKFWKEFENADIRTSWFNRLPLASLLISPLRFLQPFIWGSFNLKEYDLIISSSSWASARGFTKKIGAVEICYLHTPPRYLYGLETSRRWKGKWYGGLIYFYSKLVNGFMRKYDKAQARKVDYFLVNSKNVGKRLEEHYGSYDYKVIYPPVDVEKFMDGSIKPTKGDYYLTGGRMTASKNFDLVIEACNKMGVELKIFGSGIYEEHLRNLSNGKGIEFLGKLPEKELIRYFKGARAFIAAQKDEDFGITPVEAMAAGTPVIAYRGGGYIESVVEGKTGVFFDKPTVDSLVSGIKKLEKMKFEHKVLQTHAKKFSKERFKREISEFVQNAIR